MSVSFPPSDLLWAGARRVENWEVGGGYSCYQSRGTGNSLAVLLLPRAWVQSQVRELRSCRKKKKKRKKSSTIRLSDLDLWRRKILRDCINSSENYKQDGGWEGVVLSGRLRSESPNTELRGLVSSVSHGIFFAGNLRTPA